MDTLVVIVMLILFFFLMVFVFSTALLTPLIGKRNLIFVLSLGFTVGAVGGAFLIAPLYNDIPDMARSVYTFTSGGPEYINVNVSTSNDVSSFIANTKKIDGVKNVQTSRIILRTTPFDVTWKDSLQTRIPDTDPNIKSVQVIPNDTIVLTVQNNSDPAAVAKKLNSWLLLVGSIDIISSIVEVNIEVDPSQVDSVSSKLPQDQVVIANVTGPVEDKVAALKSSLPNPTSIVFLCGFVGLLTGLAGLFIDSIMQAWERLRKWLISRREKL